jgi:hypothetical protein
VVVNQEDETRKIYQAEWVLVASNPAVFSAPGIKKTGTTVMSKPGLKSWTDDYSNLFQAFH